MKPALSLLADNAAADVADDDVQRFTVVRVADEVIVDLMGRACGLGYAKAAGGAGEAVKDAPRPQDAIDRAFLEGVLRERTHRGGKP